MGRPRKNLRADDLVIYLSGRKGTYRVVGTRKNQGLPGSDVQIVPSDDEDAVPSSEYSFNLRRITLEEASA